MRQSKGRMRKNKGQGGRSESWMEGRREGEKEELERKRARPRRREGGRNGW